MSRIWRSTDLETTATYWRLLRRDGVAIGFTSHDRDLWFDGLMHSASPGMLPAAIRRSSGFDADSAEVSGAISHDAISDEDLRIGRYDDARVEIGLVDWENGEHLALYSGTMGAITGDGGEFSAELVSSKAVLDVDPVPRTSPSCRADFCGTGCGLSAIRFTHEAKLLAMDTATNSVTLACDIAASALVGGQLRWLDGPYAGRLMAILAINGTELVLDFPLDMAIAAGTSALVGEGCDRTLSTCSARFANAVNFQGEPFLPGNDQLVRYGLST